MLATDWTIVKSASTGLRTVFATPAGRPETYVEKNMLGMLGLVFAVGALPEIPFHHLLLPSRDWPISFSLDLAVAYSALWILGVYGIMALRPHDLRSDRFVFHRGPFSHVEIARDRVEHAFVVKEDAREAKRRYRGACYMGFPGAGLVYIRLREPVRFVHTYPMAHVREAREFLVPSDGPQELYLLLTGPDRSSRDDPRGADPAANGTCVPFP